MHKILDILGRHTGIGLIVACACLVSGTMACAVPFDNPDLYFAAVTSASDGTYYRSVGLSPDGTKLIAQKSWSDGSSHTEIVLLDADGRNEVVISTGDSQQGDIYAYMTPFWSDDGSTVGFVEVHYTTANRVLSYDLAANTTNVVYAPTTGDVCNPDFVGSSTEEIVFWQYGPVGGADLFIWDGATATNITNTPNYKEYEPVSNGDGSIILFWSGETANEPINTTHILVNELGVWTKDVGFTPILDSFWPFWTGRNDNLIGLTQYSTKDVELYDSTGAFVVDLTGPGYEGGAGQWNYFGFTGEGPVGEFVITSNALRGVLAGRDIIIAAPRSHLYIDAADGSDVFPGTWQAPFATISKGVLEASSGGTVEVAAGSYQGAVIDKQVHLDGSDIGGTNISTGVGYSPSSSALTTAFRLDAGADGTTIDDMTVLCLPGAGYYFAVFSRGVDDVTLDNITLYDAVQGLTNWGGSGWSILNNQVIGTVAANGGGIGIYVGATLGNETASNNLIQGNVIGSDASAPDYSCPGIVLALDLRYGRYDEFAIYDLGGNRIIGNTIADSGVLNGVGIEVGVIAGTGNPPESVPGILAATLGAIHDTIISENTVMGEYFGLYLYNLTGTDVYNNILSGNTSVGIGLWDGNIDNVFRYNSIAGNAYGLYNGTGSLVDAALNWWGDASGPSGEGPGSGDAVSSDVIFSPWLGIDPDGDPLLPGVQITGPQTIIVAPIDPEPAGGYLNAAIVGSNDLPFDDVIEVRHGIYDASEPITDGVTLVSEVGSAAHTILNGDVSLDSADILIGRLRQGFTLNGSITVRAGMDASTIHINWNDILGMVGNSGTGTLDATFNYWGEDGPDTLGAVAIYPLLPISSDTIIGYMDEHRLSALDAIDFAVLLDLYLTEREALVAVDLMNTFGFSEEEAASIVEEYGTIAVNRALAFCSDYQDFLALLMGYASGGGGGGGSYLGGGGADGGMPTFAVGDLIPLQLELMHPVTGEPITDAVVSYSVCRTLPDGTAEIVLLGVMKYDGDLAVYVFEVDTNGLEPGIYDVYLGTDDGRSRHFQIEVSEL